MARFDFRRRAGRCAALLLGLIAPAIAFSQPSQLEIGAATMQSVIADQLFTMQGRWYLSGDGPCYVYLESPHARIDHGRVYLDAHLSSRVGVAVRGDCVGAKLSSDMTLSGRLIGNGSTLTLDDVRIDRGADGVTAKELGQIDRAARQDLPRAFKVNVLAATRGTALAEAGIPIAVGRVQIIDVTTQASVAVVRFALSLSAP